MDSITIRTKFGKQALSKIVSKLVSDKLDCDVQLNFEEIALAHGDDGTIKLDLKVTGIADESIIKKFT